MKLRHNGNVGIGNTPSSKKLHVYGNMAIQNSNNPTLLLQGASNNSTRIMFSPGPTWGVYNEMVNFHYQASGNSNNNGMEFKVHNGTTGHYNVLTLTGVPELKFNGSVKYSSDDRLKKKETYIQGKLRKGNAPQ